MNLDGDPNIHVIYESRNLNYPSTIYECVCSTLDCGRKSVFHFNKHFSQKSARSEGKGGSFPAETCKTFRKTLRMFGRKTECKNVESFWSELITSVRD